MDEPKRNRVWELLGAGLDCPAVARSLGMGVTSVRELEANAGGDAEGPGCVGIHVELALGIAELSRMDRADGTRGAQACVIWAVTLTAGNRQDRR